jgi:hypothetical protein
MKEEEAMGLDEEITEKSKEIATDAYAMSVGELVSLYKDGELNIHPEFQRFFRWTPEQKSRFVESILLGIPIPSIFVSQTEKGAWEVIDGLQRISTLLQLMGELKNKEGEVLPPLRLMKTKYLPSLEGKVWDLPESVDELTTMAKLKIKRSRLDIKIVLNTSDTSARYELFQRLNTGATFATDQEVRNCILIMVNRTFFDWVATLSRDEGFRACVTLSERALDEQFDLELVVRFLVFRKMSASDLRGISELGSFLTEAVVGLAERSDYPRDREERAFRATFSLLAAALGEDSFKKFDPSRQKALGSTLISVFETLALGIGFYAEEGGALPDEAKVKAVHRSLWTNEQFTSATGSGVRASSRIPVTVPLGRSLFRP